MSKSSTWDYHSSEANFSRYKNSRVTQTGNGGQTVTISLTNPTQVQFQMPNKVYNLAESTIQYQYTVPAGGAGLYTCIHQGQQDLCTQIQLANGSSNPICNLLYADRFVKMAQALRTTMDDFACRDPLSTVFAPSGLSVQSNLLPFSKDGLSAGTMNSSSVPYTEQQYISIATAPNVAVTVTRTLNFSDFVDTFFSINKDFYSEEQLYINIWTQLGIRLGFYTTTPATPSLNCTSFSSAVWATPQFTNVFLNLALEDNATIAESVRASVRNGSFHMKVPCPYAYRLQSSGSTASINIPLSQQNGSKIKYIMTSLFNANESIGNLAFDNSNFNGVKCQALQSAMDQNFLVSAPLNIYNPNVPILPQALNTYNVWAEDWREIQNMVHRSVIQNYGQYASNWVYVDNFGIQDGKVYDNLDESQHNEGFQITNNTYTIQMNTPYGNLTTYPLYNSSGFAIYTFALFERELKVGPNGFELH